MIQYNILLFTTITIHQIKSHIKNPSNTNTRYKISNIINMMILVYLIYNLQLLIPL